MSTLYRVLMVMGLIALFAAPGFAQSSIFVVDDDGDPLTTYPTLAAAIATAETYPSPPYKIKIMPGSYTDEGLTVDETKIDEIYGDPSSLPGDIVFTGSGSLDFIDINGTFTIKNLYLTNYDVGVDVTDASGVMVDGLVFDACTRGVNFVGGGGTTGSTAQNCTFDGNAAWGAVIGANSSGNTIQDNCFIGNNGGGVQGYDSNGGNTWTNNFFDDYTGGAYALDGGAAASDGAPAPYGVMPVATTPQGYGDIFTVTFEIVYPTCADLVGTLTGGFEFTVTWNNAKLNYVPGSADYVDFFGSGALETEIQVGTNSLTFASANMSDPGPRTGTLAQADFEVVMASTSVNLNVSSQISDEFGSFLPTSPMFQNVVLVDDTDPVLVAADASNGAGDDTYSDGSTAGAGPFVELHMDIEATDDWDLDRLEYNYDGAAWATWTSAPTGTSYSDLLYAGGVAGLSEGPHTLSLRVVDAAGNPSNVIDYPFTVDRTPPVLTALLHLDPDCIVDTNYTNDGTFDVILSDDMTADSMQFYEMGAFSGWQSKLAYANPTTYTLLDSAQGLRDVYVRLYDRYNNMGNQLLDQITYDTLPPATTQDFALIPTTKTADTAIQGDVGTFSSAYYLYSEDPGDLVCGPGWLTPVHPFDVHLTSGEGDKVVYFTTMDLAGNLSPIQQDTVEVDQTGPEFISFVVEDVTGSDCSDSWTVKVTVGFDDAADVKWLGLRSDTLDTYTWINISAETSLYTTTYTIKPAYYACDDMNEVYGILGDDVVPSNLGTEVMDDILVDCAPPSFASGDATDLTVGEAPVSSSNWTNEDVLKIELNTVSTDIVAVEVSEDGGSNWNPVPVTTVTDPLVVEYEVQGTITECDWPTNFDVRVKDCADRTSAAATYDLVFDFTDPTVDAFTGPTLTNNLSVTLSLTASDNCSAYPPNPYLYRIAEDDDTFASATWLPFTSSPTFVLTDLSPASNDGIRTVWVQVADKAGNVSAPESIDIEVDKTKPTGTFEVVSTTPLAAPTWTNTRWVNIENITPDADVNAYQILNNDGGAGGTALTTVTTDPLPTQYLSWLLNSGQGTKTVAMRFRDAALNWGDWVNVNITFSLTVPAEPMAGSATGTPTGSTELAWGGVADAQGYIIRYNFSGDYPWYDAGLPPHPGSMMEGFLADTVWGADTYAFAGPGPDVYAFSIWTIHNNGNVSTTCNTDVMATNYILGDFYDSEGDAMGPDGCLDFVDEFGELAVAYYSDSGDGNFNEYLDIAPTFSGSPMSYPLPDRSIGFDDLILFALNYDQFVCVDGRQRDFGGRTRMGLPEPIAFSADAPAAAHVGNEYVVSFTASSVESVKGFHVVIDFNEEDFEVLSVDAGDAYQSVERSFFFFDQDASSIDASGVVLGADAQFEGSELFRAVVRAKNHADLNLEAAELTFRDFQNEDIEVSFAVNSIVNGGLPTAYALDQNYPNPFNPTTTIEMALPSASEYRLSIYNVLGQQVAVFDGYSEAGRVRVEWDATNFASGIYMYRMETPSGFEATRKMVLIK